MFKLLPLGAVAVLISACAAGPTRDEPKKFNLVRTGVVRSGDGQAFADCLLDGFDKAHFALTNVSSRQQRRTDGYRVESLAGGHLIAVSADVFDDGRVQLFEAKASALVSTSGERRAFDLCATKFAVAK